MNNAIQKHPRTVLAGALSVALMFATGGVLAQEATQDRDHATQGQAHQTHDRTGQTGQTGQAQDHDRGGMMDHESDQPINDTWITTKVKSSLLPDSDVAGLDVEVETVNGVVRLRGNVDSQAQVDRAIQIARDIEGVTDVEASGLTASGGTGDR